MSPDYRQTFLCFFVYLYLLFFPSLSFFPKAPFPTLLLLLIAFMFSSLCLLLTFPPLLPLPQRSYISRSSLLFAPPALPRRICLPPPFSSLPAVFLPPEAGCALIPVLCIIRRHDDNLCSSCVSAPRSVRHMLLFGLARPPLEGRAWSVALLGNKDLCICCLL